MDNFIDKTRFIDKISINICIKPVCLNFLSKIKEYPHKYMTKFLSKCQLCIAVKILMFKLRRILN